MPKGANCRALLTVVLASMGIILISVLRDFLIMNLLSSFSEKREAGVAVSFTTKSWMELIAQEHPEKTCCQGKPQPVPLPKLLSPYKEEN